jgi:hypothetical protein
LRIRFIVFAINSKIRQRLTKRFFGKTWSEKESEVLDILHLSLLMAIVIKTPSSEGLAEKGPEDRGLCILFELQNRDTRTIRGGTKFLKNHTKR